MDHKKTICNSEFVLIDVWFSCFSFFLGKEHCFAFETSTISTEKINNRRLNFLERKASSFEKAICLVLSILPTKKKKRKKNKRQKTIFFFKDYSGQKVSKTFVKKKLFFGEQNNIPKALFSLLKEKQG